MKRCIICLVLCVVLAVASVSAIAAGASVPVEVIVSGGVTGAAERTTIVMEAIEPDSPLPEGGADGRFVFEVIPGEAVMMPQIEFSETGVYKYHIYQKQGSEPGYTYDDQVYLVTIYVEPDGDDLFTVVVIQKTENGSKLEEIVFINVCEADPTPEPETTEKPGENPLLPTGVMDYWMYYIGGAALLLVAAAVMGYIAFRRDAGKDE